MTDKLNDNDRQRIKEAFHEAFPLSSGPGFNEFFLGYEAATRYEREQQEKELPDGIVYVIKGKYYVESSERVQDGDTLHCVVHAQVSASTEQKIGFGDTCTVNLHWDRVNFDNGEEYVYWPDKFKKLKQLEAERSELLGKIEFWKQQDQAKLIKIAELRDKLHKNGFLND